MLEVIGAFVIIMIAVIATMWFAGLLFFHGKFIGFNRKDAPAMIIILVFILFCWWVCYSLVLSKISILIS